MHTVGLTVSSRTKHFNSGDGVECLLKPREGFRDADCIFL